MPVAFVAGIPGIRHQRLHLVSRPVVVEAAHQEEFVGGPATMLVPGEGAGLATRFVWRRGAVVDPVTRLHVQRLELVRGRWEAAGKHRCSKKQDTEDGNSHGRAPWAPKNRGQSRLSSTGVDDGRLAFAAVALRCCERCGREYGTLRLVSASAAGERSGCTSTENRSGRVVVT